MVLLLLIGQHMKINHIILSFQSTTQIVPVSISRKIKVFQNDLLCIFDDVFLSDTSFLFYNFFIGIGLKLIMFWVFRIFPTLNLTHLIVVFKLKLALKIDYLLSCTMYNRVTPNVINLTSQVFLVWYCSVHFQQTPGQTALVLFLRKPLQCWSSPSDRVILGGETGRVVMVGEE